MLKLLLVAPMCDNNDVGESWSAFQFVERLSRQYDVTLLTYYKAGHQPQSEQLPGVRVIEWSEPPLVGRFERLNSMLKPGYLPFYFRARAWIRAALKAGEEFDLAHQIVPLAMRYPSPLTGLGIPYLLGPVGGSLTSPAAFEAEDSAPWYVNLRAVDAARLRHDRVLRRTYAQASCVIGIAPYVAELLSGVDVQSFAVMGDTGISELPELPDRGGRTGTVELLYVGRLVRTKGARDAIRAMAQVSDLDVRLKIAGDGFDRAACDELIVELSLGERVQLLGRVPRAEVDQLYRDADVFVFPSYREPGGNVVAEAMAFGLPLIVSDRGGPGYVVDDRSGLRVVPTSPDEFAVAIAAAIRRLAGDSALRQEMGKAARERISALSLWPNKIDQLTDIYSGVLASER
jgi:glycosyltransferase involved in cell wall biosynthesis